MCLASQLRGTHIATHLLRAPTGPLWCTHLTDNVWTAHRRFLFFCFLLFLFSFFDLFWFFGFWLFCLFVCFCFEHRRGPCDAHIWQIDILSGQLVVKTNKTPRSARQTQTPTAGSDLKVFAGSESISNFELSFHYNFPLKNMNIHMVWISSYWVCLFIFISSSPSKNLSKSSSNTPKPVKNHQKKIQTNWENPTQNLPQTNQKIKLLFNLFF